MSDWGRGQDQGQSKGRVGTWDAAERRRRVLAAVGRVPDFGSIAEHLRNWAVADAGPGRLLPWLPVAFGLGIAIYFTADREPAWWAGLCLFVVCGAIAFAGRRRPVGFPIALAGAAIAAGFAVATLKTVQMTHPVLDRPVDNATYRGLCRGARRAGAHRSYRGALAVIGGASSGQKARPGARIGQKGNRATGWRLRHISRPSEPAARTPATRRLRFRARPVISRASGRQVSCWARLRLPQRLRRPASG